MKHNFNKMLASGSIIARDLMIGNPRLAKLGFREEAEGHNAIAAGFQGQRQWTDRALSDGSETPDRQHPRGSCIQSGCGSCTSGRTPLELVCGVRPPERGT